MDGGNGSAATAWADTLRAVARNFADDQIPARAAQMSFYFFLSVFPVLLIFVAVLGLFFDVRSLAGDTIIDRLATVAPPAIARLLTQHLNTWHGSPGSR
jgi:membrane protein